MTYKYTCKKLIALYTFLFKYILLQLEAFMKLRLYEFKGDDRNNLFSFSQMQNASPILQLSTIETTQNMLDNVQVILSKILHSNVQHLHNIKHYPRYNVCD